MRIFLTFILALSALCAFAEEPQQTAEKKSEGSPVKVSEAKPYYTVCTFNMLYNLKYWNVRKEIIKSVMKWYDMDIVGTQELSDALVADIMRVGGYKHVGIGLSKNGRLNNAIFYNPKYFKVVKWGSFWYGPNPEKRSRGWDSFEGQVRACVWAKFENRSTGQIFYFFNSHLNHLYHNERLKSVHVLKDQIVKIAGKGATVICTGDFNDSPESAVLQYMTQDGFINNVRDVCLTPLHYPICSSHGFTAKTKHGNVIDHILTTKDISVLRYAIVTDGWLKYEVDPPLVPEDIGDGSNGYFPSDHYPVVAKIRFEKKDSKSEEN